MQAQAQVRASAGLPALPVETLVYIIGFLAVPATDGDESAICCLLRLSAVSKRVRVAALSALYSVIILPRYITKLTTVSAGWEAEMLRFLFYCGSTITHLSLWETESRALLRDAAQVPGANTAATQPIWAIGEQMLLHSTEASCTDAKKMDTEDMPGWLRAELLASGAKQVAKAHPAHFPLEPRSNAGDRWHTRPKPRPCTPVFLSIVLSYPFFANENPIAFANMVIWSRVEELDVYAPFEMHKSLHLLSQLGNTHIRRLRISSQHATIAIETMSDVPKEDKWGNALPPLRWKNACAVLAFLLTSSELLQAFLNEFLGRHISDPILLEAACLHLLTDGSHLPSGAVGAALETETKKMRDALAMRFKVTQRNQAIWGKLRHRAWDFRERAQFRRQGAWDALLN
ncbi:hypothetical protein MVES_002380 [Malassezia vespertilionis]|uniref:F-box domain-containing protein n=1 Tax=Malassezia vespertilionis TaxID=2020962 RepID=A0A2N1JAM0_9BASI|nr:hypothetical protein MVES_002380 [Malassezia vespertilionis]